MNLTVNTDALNHALDLMKTGKWALNTVWARNQPTPSQAAEFRAAHGEDALRLWYLAMDDQGNYHLPFGDFNRVHRSGVVMAKRQAEQAGAMDTVEAADEILDLFDRLNAC